MVTQAGVDGCQRGWVVVTEHQASVQPDIAAVVGALPADAVVAIDVPVGLPTLHESGGRACDRAARALLGDRRSSVFTPPPRHALESRSLAEARERGWPATLQALRILPKIEQVDAVMTPALQARVFEAHPELAFRAMGGDRPLAPKRSPAGAARRRALLTRCGIPVPDRPPGASEDDLLDACALLWSARRIAAGRGRRVPDPPPVDARGLRMEIRW